MKLLLDHHVFTKSDFILLVESIARELKGNEIVLLSGDLGVGKTEFVKVLARYFGISQEVQSPTFSLYNVYPTSLLELIHFDLYRVKDMSELESIGFWDILVENSLICIEWPERVPKEYWPKNRRILNIKIQKTENTSKAPEERAVSVYLLS